MKRLAPPAAALLAAAALGAGASWWQLCRRASPARVLRPRAARSAGWGSTPSSGEGPGGDQEADAPEAVNLKVAAAVLEVADRLTSAELCRRLGAALGELGGVAVIVPTKGSDFDPLEHSWDETLPVPEGTKARTIAATKVPGLLAPDGSVVRKARVAVFEEFDQGSKRVQRLPDEPHVQRERNQSP
jgi:hypothetical protein